MFLPAFKPTFRCDMLADCLTFRIDRLIDGIVSNPEDALIIERFGSTFRNLLHKSSGKEHLSVYTHFAHGDEGAKAWFSEANIPKLRALKQKYDPDSLFSFYNSVWKD